MIPKATYCYISSKENKSFIYTYRIFLKLKTKIGIKVDNNFCKHKKVSGCKTYKRAHKKFIMTFQHLQISDDLDECQNVSINFVCFLYVFFVWKIFFGKIYLLLFPILHYLYFSTLLFHVVS